jgi:alpha-galactosidase
MEFPKESQSSAREALACCLAQGGYGLRPAEAVAPAHPLLPPALVPWAVDLDGEETAPGDWNAEPLASYAAAGGRCLERRFRHTPSGLVVVSRAMLFDHLPAVEFRLTIENRGHSASALITRARSLALGTPKVKTRPLLTSCAGGLTGTTYPDRGFRLDRTPLASEAHLLSAAGGRSSNRDLPFFLLALPDAGLCFGVGWSGQWQAQLRWHESEEELRVDIELPGLRLRIPAGESITLPSILLGTYFGPAEVGSNLLRRTLYERYVPLLEGAQPLPPTSFNHWFSMDNDISEENLRAQAEVAARIGLEYFCVDSGWFVGGFPEGVGNWILDREKFPNGLKPLADCARTKGMRFGLWFEPERVADGTRLEREHPEWVNDNLLDLGNPEARNWVAEMMDSLINEAGIQWIRFDFNIDPLPVWEKIEGEEERGLRQIRHLEGLYQLLDHLLQAHPSLLIEGCASGGRRIDLETVRRCHTFWKSDETWDLPTLRTHITGGNVFLPSVALNVNLLHPGPAFAFRSLFGGPLGIGARLSDWSEEVVQLARREVALYKSLRPHLLGDYYPLFEQPRDTQVWEGWQFHDPEEQAGFAVVLRLEDSPYECARVRLRGLAPGATYLLTDVDSGQESSLTGAELMEGLPVALPQPALCRLITYRARA